MSHIILNLDWVFFEALPHLISQFDFNSGDIEAFLFLFLYIILMERRNFLIDGVFNDGRVQVHHQKYGLKAMKKQLVLIDVHVLRGYSMPSYLSSSNDAETIFADNRFI